jgi:hypothetical protein
LQFKTRDAKRCTKNTRPCSAKLKKLDDKLAVAKADEDAELVLDLKRKLSEASEAVEQFCNAGECSTRVQLLEGAKILVAGIQKFLKPKCNMPRGQAEHAFNGGVQAAGAICRAEHGGFELSNSDNMKVLERFDQLCDFMSAACPTEPDKQRCLEAFMNAINHDLPRPTLKVVTLMKSQKKMDLKRQKTLKTEIRNVCAGWCKHFPNQDVFLKLHCIICHLVAFCLAYQMCGILSEEGFEATHPVMASEKNRTKSMGSVAGRVETVLHRFQRRTDPEMQKLDAKVTASTKTTANRPAKYQTLAKTARNADSLAVQSTDLAPGPEGHLYCNDDQTAIIKEGWADVFLLVVKVKVPKAWSDPFEESENLGSVAALRSKYVNS